MNANWRPASPIGWVLALLGLLLSILVMVGVLPFTPVVVGGLLVVAFVARLV